MKISTHSKINRGLNTIHYNPSLPESEEYRSYHECKGHQSPLLGPMKVPGRAYPIGLPQRVCPYSLDNFQTAKHSTSSGTKPDRLVQDDWLTTRIPLIQSVLPSSPSFIYCIYWIKYYSMLLTFAVHPSVHAAHWWDPPPTQGRLQDPFVDGIFPTQRRLQHPSIHPPHWWNFSHSKATAISIHSYTSLMVFSPREPPADEISPTRRQLQHSSIHPHAPLMGFPPLRGENVIPLLLGFPPLRGSCLYTLLMGFFTLESVNADLYMSFSR